jgi:RNA polymerase sigma-70 factor (ECF subfamily)
VKDPIATIELLHKKYAGVLYDKCVRMLADRQEAEDAVQETFINAFRGLEQFRYGDSHLPWLYRIATNVCLKVIRTRQRKGTSLLDKPDREAGHGQDMDTCLQFRSILEQVTAQLDQRSLEIMVGYYLDGMDQSEIAGSLRISRRAVVKRLTAMRQLVGGLLEEN